MYNIMNCSKGPLSNIKGIMQVMQGEKVYFLLCVKWFKQNDSDRKLDITQGKSQASKDNLADTILV